MKKMFQSVNTQTNDIQDYKCIDYKCINDQQSELFTQSQLYMHRDICILICDYLNHDGVVINPDFRLYLISSNIFTPMKVAILHPALVHMGWHETRMGELVFRIKTETKHPVSSLRHISYRCRNLHPLDQKFMVISDKLYSIYSQSVQCGPNIFVSKFNDSLDPKRANLVAMKVNEDSSMDNLGFIENNWSGNLIIGISDGCVFSIPQSASKLYITVANMSMDEFVFPLPNRTFHFDTICDTHGLSLNSTHGNSSHGLTNVSMIVRDEWLFVGWKQTFSKSRNTGPNEAFPVRIQAYYLPPKGWFHDKDSTSVPAPSWEIKLEKITSQLGHPIDISVLLQMEFEPYSKTLWLLFSLMGEIERAWCYIRTDARLNPYKPLSHEPVFA